MKGSERTQERFLLSKYTEILLYTEHKSCVSMKCMRILHLRLIAGILNPVTHQISCRNRAPHMRLSYVVSRNERRCEIHALPLTYVLSDYVIEEKTATLQKRDSEGFGFVLRGAKGNVNVNVYYSHTSIYTHTYTICIYYYVCVRSLLPAETPIEEFTPTPAFPALQYLESVDLDGVAWRAGLRTGDFLIEVRSCEI